MKHSIDNEEGRALAKILYQTVHTYFQSEVNRIAFREWYRKKYGKEYAEVQGVKNVKQ